MKRDIILLLVFLFSASSAFGRDTSHVARLSHHIGTSFNAGYNLPSHGYYNGYNEKGKVIRANSSLHLKYGFGYTGATETGLLYPGVVQGVGLAVCTFYEHSLMGTPILAYIYQNAEILRLSSSLSLDYGWGLGASYGWRKSDMNASRVNLYVNIGLMLSWDVSPSWTLGIGPEFTHYSNGDTKFPNGGANLFDFKVSAIGHLAPLNKATDKGYIWKYEEELRQKKFADRMFYDLIFYGGWRAGKVSADVHALINRPFSVLGLNFIPQYRLNRHFSVGASMDLIMDRSADIYNVTTDQETSELISYSLPPAYQQIGAGLSLRGDVTMPIFTVGVGAGCFLPGLSDTLKGAYAIFNLKAFVTDHLFISMAYRLSSINFTHNVMYGLGWRFN